MEGEPERIDDPTSVDDRRASAVDRAYGSLKSAIIEARLGPGTPLSQNKLAAHLGVSRTPVREALLRLEHDGLVQRTADLGFVVATITPDEVDEACDLLKLLDTFVYVHAARVLTTEQLDDLLDLAKSMVRSAEQGDTEAWKAADLRYHETVMSAASNRFVAEYLKTTRGRVQRFWLQTPDFDGRLRICSHDHIALAEAMVERDEDVLTETVHEHIERLRAGVLLRLETLGSLLPSLDPLARVAGGERPTARGRGA